MDVLNKGHSHARSVPHEIADENPELGNAVEYRPGLDGEWAVISGDKVRVHEPASIVEGGAILVPPGSGSTRARRRREKSEGVVEKDSGGAVHLWTDRPHLSTRCPKVQHSAHRGGGEKPTQPGRAQSQHRLLDTAIV